MSFTAVAILGLLAGLAVGLVIAIVSRRQGRQGRGPDDRGET